MLRHASHWTAINHRVDSTIEMYYVAVYSHNHSVTITHVLSSSRWWSSDWWNIHINSYFSEWSKICLMSNLVEIQIQGMKTIIWVKFPFSCRRHCLIILIIIVLSFTNRLSRTSLYLSLKTSFVYSNLFSLAKTVTITVIVTVIVGLFPSLSRFQQEKLPRDIVWRTTI